MKRIFLMTLAAAMLLGLTQCKKPTPWGDDNTSGGLKTVTFTVNDDSKGDFVEEQDGASARRLRYKWADGDKLYVYGSVNGDFESDGEFIGTLTTHNTGYSALFRGELNLKKYNTTHSKLRFYHFGSGVTFTSGAATSNLTSQDGTMGAVSSKVIACSEDFTVKNESEYTSPLTIKFAVAKLDLTKFAAGESSSIAVKMKTSSGTQVNVSAQGVLTYSGQDGTCTLGGVSTSSNAYDVILLPASVGKVHLDFSTEANDKTCSGDMKVEANKFYYNKNNPNTGVVINAEGPQHLEGVFTVDANGTKVQFSRGNLYYKDGVWGFMDNQWDYYTLPGYMWCADKTYHSSGSPGQGLFSWSCSQTNYGIKVDGGHHDDGTFVDYGKKIGDGTEWFTLTSDQWDYVVNKRDNAAFLRGVYWSTLDIANDGDDARVIGLVLFPDGTTEDQKKSVTNAYLASTIGNVPGAVFLPANGYASSKEVEEESVGGFGFTAFYWTSSSYKTKGTVPYNFVINYGGNHYNSGNNNCTGHSVRLVRLAPTSK